MAPRRSSIPISDLVHPQHHALPEHPTENNFTQVSAAASHLVDELPSHLFPSITLDSHGFPIQPSAATPSITLRPGDTSSSRSSHSGKPLAKDHPITPNLVSPTRIQDQHRAPPLRRLQPRRSPLSAPPRTDRMLKGPWKPAETALLASLVERHGPCNWAQIARSIPGRSGKQARERWKNHLDPDLKKGNWTNEEDETILKLFNSFGKKWSTIARHLRGRSDNDVKNRYNAALCDPKERALNDAHRKASSKEKLPIPTAPRRDMLAQLRAARPSVFNYPQ